jgi:hypothetical protein
MELLCRLSQRVPVNSFVVSFRGSSSFATSLQPYCMELAKVEAEFAIKITMQ